jgi:DNA polymerase III, alpha subunit
LQLLKVDWLADVKDRKVQSITINANLHAIDVTLVAELSDLVRNSEGESSLNFHIIDPESGQYVTLSSRDSRINVTRELIHYIESHPALTYRIN